MSGRHIMVDAVCKFCGKEFKVKRCYLAEGKRGKFCSIQCSGHWQSKQRGKQHVGKENAAKSWDNRGRWMAYWYDESGKQHSSTYARWWWELNVGEVPKGYRVSYKDGNPKNISPDNFIIISPKEFGQKISERLQGHTFSPETLEKMSERKRGKPLSENHRLNIGNSVRERWARGMFDDVHKGEHHRKWRGGSEKSYPREFINLRAEILERDKFRCRICHKKSTRLDVHHIDRDKINNNQDNLISLCVKCHHRIHEGINEIDPVFLAFQSALK